jgi:hypothetical protein
MSIFIATTASSGMKTDWDDSCPCKLLPNDNANAMQMPLQSTEENEQTGE